MDERIIMISTEEAKDLCDSVKDALKALKWNNLTKEERRRYMRLQMSPRGYYDRSGYLPEDCGYCGACGNPTIGGGWCRDCHNEYRMLKNKLEGKND